MTAIREPKLVARDNGYFEVWEKPNGERVRVSTEDHQYALRRLGTGYRKQLHAATRQRLGGRS